MHQRTLYMLRHGEIATPGILAGKTDVALSEAGFQQLCNSTEQLAEIAQCISSPLQRCQQFARHFTDKNNIELAIEVKLKEMDFGDWDGKKYQDLWQIKATEQNTSLGDFWQNPWQHTPPNGEAMADFTQRVDTWWQQWLAEASEGNTLLISHGGVIKHLIARILNMPIPGTDHMSNIDVPYAGLVKVGVYRDEQGKVWPKIIW